MWIRRVHGMKNLLRLAFDLFIYSDFCMRTLPIFSWSQSLLHPLHFAWLRLAMTGGTSIFKNILLFHSLIVTCIALCTPRLPNFCQSAKINVVPLFGVSPRSDINIQPISVCHVSNERKQMFNQIYNLLFWVQVIPWELWSLLCTL